MKVLVSAYACSPGRGSEAGAGWHSALQIVRFHEVWVLTRPCNEAAISTALAQQPLANAHWVYFDLPRWARWWNRQDRGIHFHYYLWQVGAYFVGRRLHRQVRFDLAHHVTHGCYWMPSFLALLPVPFVWGPVGGGESTPRGFWGSLSLYGKVYEIMRSIAQWIGRRDPFVRLTAWRAGIGMASTEGTEARLRELGCRETMVFPTGLPECDRLRLGGIPFRQGSPFRACSVGNLLHLKGCELGLRAFAEAQLEVASSEYWIVGDGPERKRLEVLSGELGVAANVMFWGMIPREQALERLAACDVLLHPSLHDSNPTACLEAMAAGRPVICLDLSGPALQVTGDTGIKVPALTPKQAVTGLASAMVRLARDPALRERMGRAAQCRVEEHYSSDKKGKTWAAIYERVVRERHPSTREASHWD
jgi:glycosyltransferase involved in cell wall biosynthesis